MPACVRVTFWLAVRGFTRAGLRRLDGCRVNDINPSFSHDDALLLKLAVDLAQQGLPQIVLDQRLAKPSNRRGIRNRTPQLKVAELAEKQVAKQCLAQSNTASASSKPRRLACSRSALVMKSAGWVLNEFCINQTIKLK